MGETYKAYNKESFPKSYHFEEVDLELKPSLFHSKAHDPHIKPAVLYV